MIDVGDYITIKREEYAELTDKPKISLAEYEHLAAAHVDALAELVQLRKEKNIWAKVCQHELERWNKWKDLFPAVSAKDYPEHLKNLTELAEQYYNDH